MGKFKNKGKLTGQAKIDNLKKFGTPKVEPPIINPKTGKRRSLELVEETARQNQPEVKEIKVDEKIIPEPIKPEVKVEPTVKPEVKVEPTVKPEVKVEPTVKPEVKPTETKVEPIKPEVKPTETGNQLLRDTFLKYQNLGNQEVTRQLQLSQAAIESKQIENRQIEVNGKPYDQPLEVKLGDRTYTYKDNDFYSDKGRKITGKKTLADIQKKFEFTIAFKDFEIKQHQDAQRRNEKQTKDQARQKGQEKIPKPKQDILYSDFVLSQQTGRAKEITENKIRRQEVQITEAVKDAIRGKDVNVGFTGFRITNKSDYLKWIKEVKFQGFDEKGKRIGQFKLTDKQINRIYDTAKRTVNKEEANIKRVEQLNNKAKITQGQFKKPEDKIVVDRAVELKRQLRLESKATAKGVKIGKKEQQKIQKEKETNWKKIKDEVKDYAKSVLGKRTDAYKAIEARIERLQKPTLNNRNILKEKIDEIKLTSDKKKVISSIKNEMIKLDKLNKEKKLTGEFKEEYQKIKKTVDKVQITEKTKKSIESSKEYFERTGKPIPESVKRKIERLDKEPLNKMDITTLDILATKLSDIFTKADRKIEQLNTKLEKQTQRNVNDFKNQRSLISETIKKGEYEETFQKLLSGKRFLDLTPSMQAWAIDGFPNKILNGVEVVDKNAVVQKVFVQNIYKGDDVRYKVMQDAYTILRVANTEGVKQQMQKRNLKAIMEGKEVQISKAMRIQMYIDSQIRQNQNHQLNGGYVVYPKKQSKQGLAGFKETFGERKGKLFKPTKDEVNKIIDKLTADEFRIADAILKVYKDVCKPAIDKATMETEGKIVTLGKDELYYPINVSKYYGKVGNKGVENILQPERIGFEQSKDFFIGQENFLKTRKSQAKQPIILGDAIANTYRMIDAISTYAGYAKPLQEANNLLKNDEFINLVQTRAGDLYFKSLEYIVKDLQSPREPNIAYQFTRLDKLQRAGTQAILMQNYKVGTMQRLSYVLALNYMPVKYGKLLFDLIPPASWDKMSKYSSFAWARAEGRFSIAYGEATLEGKNAAITKKLMGNISWGDRQGVGRIWTSIEYWVRDTTNLKGDALQFEVGKRWNEIVRKTQPTFETIDRPYLARSRDVALQQITMFSSQGNKLRAINFENDIRYLNTLKGKENLDERTKLKRTQDWAKRAILTRVANPVIVSLHNSVWSVFQKGGWAYAQGVTPDELEIEKMDDFITAFQNNALQYGTTGDGLIINQIVQAVRFAGNKWLRRATQWNINAYNKTFLPTEMLKKVYVDSINLYKDCYVLFALSNNDMPIQKEHRRNVGKSVLDIIDSGSKLAGYGAVNVTKLVTSLAYWGIWLNNNRKEFIENYKEEQMLKAISEQNKNKIILDK